MNQKDYMTLDTLERQRTYADRRAFLRAEAELATAATLQAPVAPPAPLDTSTRVDRAWERRKQRDLTRQEASNLQRQAFLYVLGEITYRALPLDDHEKAPFRTAIMEQTAELALALSSQWNLSATGKELVEATTALATLDDAPALIKESLATGSLDAYITPIVDTLTERVVAAVVHERERAAKLEQQLQEVTEAPTGDAELDAYRARRTAKRASISLMEALFIANRKSLTEDVGHTVPHGVIMAEAVSQYTLLETLSALGLMHIDRTDVERVATILVNRKV